MEKEECSSSESGWTTYISSPIEEDEDGVVDEDYNEGYNIYNHYRKSENEEEKNKDSDDSMTSDASSGPTTYQRYHQKNIKGRGKEGLAPKNEGKTKSNDDDDDDDAKKNGNSYRNKEKKKREFKNTYRSK